MYHNKYNILEEECLKWPLVPYFTVRDARHNHVRKLFIQKDTLLITNHRDDVKLTFHFKEIYWWNAKKKSFKFFAGKQWHTYNLKEEAAGQDLSDELLKKVIFYMRDNQMTIPEKYAWMVQGCDE